MKFLLFITMFALLSNHPEEKRGCVSGAVFNAKNDEPLSGIIIHILGTTHQQLTDDRGTFEFSDIIPGIYNLEFRSMWYQPLKLENVVVKAGEPTVLKVSLARNEIDASITMDSIIRNKRGARSNMIIVKPDPGIDYKMLIIKPDSTIEYK